jgi:hypothetical protein
VSAEPGPPWTWENITPEQYEISPFISGWPWCAPGEFPISYKWEAPCVPVDPCQDTEFGGATLWEGKPCDIATHPYVIGRGAADPKVTTTTVLVDSGEPLVVVTDPWIADDTVPVVAALTNGEPNATTLPATGVEVTLAVVASLLLAAGSTIVAVARRH